MFLPPIQLNINLTRRGEGIGGGGEGGSPHPLLPGIIYSYMQQNNKHLHICKCSFYQICLYHIFAYINKLALPRYLHICKYSFFIYVSIVYLHIGIYYLSLHICIYNIFHYGIYIFIIYLHISIN